MHGLRTDGQTDRQTAQMSTATARSNRVKCGLITEYLRYSSNGGAGVINVKVRIDSL